jgi:anti-anti-sigma regulatory factor
MDNGFYNDKEYFLDLYLNKYRILLQYMKLKIDTKEKFKVITPEVKDLTAILSDQFQILLTNHLNDPIPNIILNLKDVEYISREVGQMLQDVQQSFYNKNHSFVICCLQNAAEKQLDEWEILEYLNITPTESEAWDIIQMEEIERELLDGENDFE